MNTKSYNELLESMKNSMIANQSKVTDFNEGSIIMTIFESIARVLESAYIETRAGYTNNLKAIAYSLFNFSKKTGSKATVEVRFKRSKAVSTSVTIPSNTRISDGTYIFVTSQNGTIKKDEIESNLISAQAVDIGLDYNVNPNTITIIESSLPSEIVEVYNPSKATGGADEESETAMLSRFKNYINGLQKTNLYGIKSGILSLTGVRSIGIKEHYPPKQNVYNATIYIDDGTGKMTDTLKDEITTLLNGDGSIVNSGLRAAGVNFEISPAEIVSINISVKCKIYRTDNAVANNDIKNAIESYINGLGINESVNLTDIIIKLRRISYIKDVSNLYINNTQENVIISESQIARLNNCSITLTAV